MNTIISKGVPKLDPKYNAAGMSGRVVEIAGPVSTGKVLIATRMPASIGGVAA